jgi:hypothetical protein
MSEKYVINILDSNIPDSETPDSDNLNNDIPITLFSNIDEPQKITMRYLLSVCADYVPCSLNLQHTFSLLCILFW